MNHFPKHVGDWITATAHLSEVEECIYSRMIDQYYARESPLPEDVKSVTRLVRASSAEARRAVPVMLHEFFKLESDGWHQKRCDDEIALFREGQKDAEAARNNDKERQRRTRERRARLFEGLRLRGVTPPYTATNAELEAMLSAFGNAGVTRDITSDDTVIQNQNQNQNQGVKPELCTDAEGQSRKNRLGDKSPENPKPQTNGQGWWKTEAGITAHGKAIGIPPKRGESTADYKARLFTVSHQRRPKP